MDGGMVEESLKDERSSKMRSMRALKNVVSQWHRIENYLSIDKMILSHLPVHWERVVKP
jgi:hypothetical protein